MNQILVVEFNFQSLFNSLLENNQELFDLSIDHVYQNLLKLSNTDFDELGSLLSNFDWNKITNDNNCYRLSCLLMDIVISYPLNGIIIVENLIVSFGNGISELIQDINIKNDEIYYSLVNKRRLDLIK